MQCCLYSSGKAGSVQISWHLGVLGQGLILGTGSKMQAVFLESGLGKPSVTVLPRLLPLSRYLVKTLYYKTWSGWVKPSIQ